MTSKSVHPFPVVGMGASAGGLEAIEEFLEHMPSDSGIALVIVTHQHPGHHSLLPELLARDTTMPVVEATSGMTVQPDHVYLCPPGAQLSIRDGKLYEMEAATTTSAAGLDRVELDVDSPKVGDAGYGRANRLPIDYFFRSLADERHQYAIGIVLSGTGSDGTLGLQAIKAEFGMAMIQSPRTAKYAGMPSSAEATGLVDYILPVAELPRRL